MDRQKSTLVLAVVLSCAGICFGKYSGGTGEPSNPYIIATAEDMNEIGANPDDWDAHFLLVADINLADYTGTQFNIIGVYISQSQNGPFTGVFDGNDHKVLNFTWTSTNRNYIGLFGYVGTGGEVKNLGMENVDVNIVNRNYVGGLVAYNFGTISNCYSTGSVTGSSYVGGLVGWNEQGTITNCYSDANVTGNSTVGGLVGRNYGTISNCYSTSSVLGTGNYIGGLVGRNYGTITNCYSAGSVTGSSYVGGLVGIGNDDYVIASFWDVNTSGQTSSAGGEGKTTAEMKTEITYSGWSGCGNWMIDEGNDYPHLAWEGKPGQPIHISDFFEGSGTQDDPYQVYTPEELNLIGLFPCELDKYFILLNDVNLSQYTGTQFNIIGTDYYRFTGVFDGNGHTISNFTYECTDTDYIGIFGYVDDPNAEIKNLTLTDPDVNAEDGIYVGCLAGRFENGTISGCSVEGSSVSGGSYVGGLSGSNSGTITDCNATGSVSGGGYVGGLVGENGGDIENCYSTVGVSGGSCSAGLVGKNSGTITNCYSKGIVSGEGYVGGLVGYNLRGTITNCYSTGSVSGTGYYTGGLVGCNNGTITNCYSTGNISGGGGGLVGYNHEGTITDCYATGSVSGGAGGAGLVAVNYGTITNCYSTGNVSGISHFAGTVVGGLVHHNHGTITNCYSTGNVSGTAHYVELADCVGGLVGYNDGTVTKCYSTGNVSGTLEYQIGENYVGGLVGDNDGTITHCYSTGYVSGGVTKCYPPWECHCDECYVGGLVGYSDSCGCVCGSFWDVGASGRSTSACGIGKTTAEMQNINTFLDAGWDFVGETNNGTCNYWDIPTGGGYPIFSTPGEPLGSGTEEDPYVITDANDLGRIWYRPLAHYILSNDIDLEGIEWSIAVVPMFNGIFNGNGFCIKNLSITACACENLGLFGRIDSESTVKNLGLENCAVRSFSYYPYVGGLAGWNNSGTITNCYSTGSVSGNERIGGLVGSNSGIYCYYGQVCYDYGMITNCYSDANISGVNDVGGLVGYNGGKIENCYSTDSVTGNSKVGGLVGRNYIYCSDSGYCSFGLIEKCYSTGFVTGDSDVGGLVGSGNLNCVDASFWDVNTSGQTSSAGGEGKATTEMKTRSTFTDAGWDFVGETVNGTEDIWDICEGTNYPRLAWQFLLGDFLCPDGVNFIDYSFFARHWLEDNCGRLDDCDGTDLDFSGTVDVNDLKIFCNYWLEGI